MVTIICPKCGAKYELGKHHVCKVNKHIKIMDNGNKTKADEIIHSKKWKNLRKQILLRDHFLCQRCLIKFHYYNSDNLTVHHIIARIHSSELGFNPLNLITVCKTCNNQLGVADKLDFEWNPQEKNKNFLKEV